MLRQTTRKHSSCYQRNSPGYVADEDARLELDYKIFCVLKAQAETLNPEDSLLRLLEEFNNFAK